MKNFCIQCDCLTLKTDSDRIAWNLKRVSSRIEICNPALCLSLSLCLSISLSVCVHVCVYLYMCVCMCACMHACMQVKTNDLCFLLISFLMNPCEYWNSWHNLPPPPNNNANVWNSSVISHNFPIQTNSYFWWFF